MLICFFLFIFFDSVVSSCSASSCTSCVANGGNYEKRFFLALFGSFGNLLSAEGGQELVQILPKDGLLVLNGDNKYCLDLYKKTDLPKKIYTASKGNIDSDAWADAVTIKKDNISQMKFLD